MGAFVVLYYSYHRAGYKLWGGLTNRLLGKPQSPETRQGALKIHLTFLVAAVCFEKNVGRRTYCSYPAKKLVKTEC